MFRTIMEQLETDPVPLGTSHIPNHIPPRRCGGLCFKRPCASRRDTPHERARARDEHHSPAMPTAHAFYARNGARDPERAGFRVSGRCRRRVVGGRRSCVWVFYRRAKRRQAPLWEIKIPGTRGLFICSVRDLPWADPPLPGTKRPKGRAGDHREAGHFPDLGLL
jgi:hypothetical protein